MRSFFYKGPFDFARAKLRVALLRGFYFFLVTTNISKSSVVSFLSRFQFPSSAAYMSISENPAIFNSQVISDGT